MLFAGDDQEMEGRHHCHPGNEGRILHRVPGPETSKGERNIGPGASQQNADTQERQGDKHPRNDRFQPLRIGSAHQGRHSVGEWNQCQRITNEKNRRMDRHPVVLQQRVETIAIGQHRKVIRRLENGVLYITVRFSKQKERAVPHLESAQADTQNHADEERIGQSVDPHDRRFPLLRTVEKETTDQRLPDRPYHETSLLPCPETGNDVLDRQCFRRITPDIGILEIMIEDEVVKYSGGTKNGKSSREIKYARPVFHQPVFGICRSCPQKEKQRRKQTGDESNPDQCLADLAR